MSPADVLANSSLHYDFRAPPFGPSPAEIYVTALEQCSWADRLGFGRVVISSHHGCEDNYGPAPVVAATAVAARTSRLRIVPVIALPLYHPLHVAEDLAVLDLLSGGRIDVVFAAGYRREEFAMFGRSMSDRGALMEEGISAIRQAWTGEPFEFRGATIRVTPRPFQRPGPAIIMAGDSRAAARRAARLADAFAPMTGGDSWRHYVDACAELGKPVPPERRGQRAMFVYVSEDPEAAWTVLAPNLLHVNNSYASWMAADGRAATYVPAERVEDLKASPAFEIVTPEQCVAMIREQGGILLDPLFGGIAPEAAWACLELFENKVLPALTQPDAATERGPA